MVTAKGPGVATPVRTCFAVTLLCAIAVSLSQIALLRTFVRENNAADVTRVEDSVTRVLAYESKGRALEVELAEGNHTTFHASEVLLEVENFHHQAFQNSSDPQHGVVGSSFVTITTQTSISRISRVPEICRRWKGPIVVSFFREGNQSLDEGMKRLISEECNDIRLITYEFSEFHKDDWYPVNTLRNKAREAAQTSHYLMIDIDMLPSMELLETISHFEKAIRGDAFLAVVVPVFEYVGLTCNEDEECSRILPTVPKTFQKLFQCVKEKVCQVFEERNNPYGHSTTNSAEWFDHEEDVLMEIPCFKSKRYEPYVIVPNHDDTPKFDERFAGYGKNKIEHVNHLRWAGFSFKVLPSSFLIHAPHARSDSKQHWSSKNGINMRIHNDELFKDFMTQIWRKYQKPRTTICGVLVAETYEATNITYQAGDWGKKWSEKRRAKG